MSTSTVDAPLLLTAEKSRHSVLNLCFNFLPIRVVNPKDAEMEWTFRFDDSDTQLPLRELKEKHYVKGGFWYAVVLLEDPTAKTIYRPHRFVVTIEKEPVRVYGRDQFLMALNFALQRVQSEMEMRLRQAFYRQPDPLVTYGKICEFRDNRAITTTYITSFVKR